MNTQEKFDVIILGAGLAGLSLCRQLLLNSNDKKILLLDNRADLPGAKQKVGESLVQVAGYYFTRILDLEEHLLREHYPKYNLRFHWKTAGRANKDLLDYSYSYIGKGSNVATYQINRNKLEEHLLALTLGNPNVALCAPIAALQVDLSENGLHRVSFHTEGKSREVWGEWIVDTTGRAQILKKKKSLKMESPIRHGSSWCWVEGLVNIEKLTDLSQGEIRRRRDAQRQGLFPIWLATNHFCGEGLWFWIIPLQGLTSLGVVYDSSLYAHEKFSTAEKMIRWICEEFPLFQRDLPKRKILDSARFTEFSYDCKQTISSSRWAMSGMSGRFSDPLYSSGSDLIAFYNTFIVDAILEKDPDQLKMKAQIYEAMMKVLYDAYVPSYFVSYDALGDQEIFTLKYGWELAVYFAFYAFPFINDLFTNLRFAKFFFRKFALLGPINRNLQKFLSDYYQWKKMQPPREEPIANDFLDLTSLKRMEMSYYKTGLSIDLAEEELEGHLNNLKEFARFIYAYVSSIVLGDNQALLNVAFVSSIKLSSLSFNPEALRQAYAGHAGCSETYDWNVDPFVMEKFRTQVVDNSASVAAANRQ
jgi:2-polyprenyl-6-methoxyphenol hydroxylase-like FAD-dependent oxidoreductase